MFMLERGGHIMEINRSHGQGGEVEDVFFWCHTCDPFGKSLNTIDVYGDHALMLTAVGYLMDKCREHAETEPE
jgi:hypothetical protein